MEDIIVQSAMAEIAMWDAFHTGRGANATGLLALILGFWVAARFSSVSLEKNVNLFGKIIITAFAVSIFMMSVIVFTILAIFLKVKPQLLLHLMLQMVMLILVLLLKLI